MNAIYSYLESMFAGLPKTDDVQRAREELGQMMEDKFNELRQAGVSEHAAVGQVIAEFGSIDELKESLHLDKENVDADNTLTLRQRDVDDFLTKQIDKGIKISYGVALFIVSVAPVAAFNFLGELSIFNEDLLTALGLAIMFLSIAAGLYLVITAKPADDKTDLYEKTPIVLDGMTQLMIDEEYRDFKESYSSRLAIAIGIIVLAVVPIIIGSVALNENSVIMAVAISLLFIMTAIGVSQIIQLTFKKSGYDILLNRNDYKPTAKRDMQQNERFSSAYWSIILIVYFIISFSVGWGYSWLVFPFSGLLYSAISSMIAGNNDIRRR